MSLTQEIFPFQQLMTRIFNQIVCLILALSIVTCGGGESVDRSGASVDPKKSFNSLTWTGFPEEATVGIDTEDIGRPTSFPIADTYEIESPSDNCLWNDSAQTLSFVDTDWCIIKVTITKQGYDTVSKEFSVRPKAGSFSSIGWTQFPAEAKVGVNTNSLEGPASVPAADDYTVEKKSGDCFWDDENNDLSFTNTTECTLTVTATKRGYNPFSEDFSVTPVNGDISTINWTVFPSSGVVGTPITGIADPVSVPAADSYYIAKKSGDCSWDDSNDTLSFTNTTECILTVTTAKVAYNTFSKDFSVTPIAGDISTINWTAFPSSGVVGTPITGMADPVSVPAADNYDIAKKSGDCSWDDSNDALSFTNTTECILTVTTTKVGYNPLSKDFNITPVAGDIKSLKWVAFPSSGVVGTPITGIADPVSVPAADSYGIAKKSGDCSWDDSNDALSFTNTTECVLTVTTRKTGYNPLSKDFNITPTAGDISAINWTAFPSSGVVGTPITGIADPVSVPAADSYDIAKKSGDCSWDNNTNDALSFTMDITECILTVTATTKVGYTSRTKDFRYLLQQLDDIQGYQLAGTFPSSANRWELPLPVLLNLFRFRPPTIIRYSKKVW